MINNGIKGFFIKGEDAMIIQTVMATPGRISKGLALLAIAWAICLIPLPSGAVDLMHNSEGTGSTKWAAQGGWGVTSGKYGKFECSTCHEPNKKPNIKNVRRVLTTQNGENWPNGSPSVGVSFSNVTSMGEDAGGHATSSRICEACHSQNKFHNADTANNIANGGNLSHPTPKAICTTCHKHNTGFKAACGGCHGNPPSEAVLGGDTGLIGTPRASNALVSGQAGAHVTHTEARGMVCDTCHYISNGTIRMPNLSNSLDIGFYGFGGKVTSGTYVPYSSVDRGYSVSSGTPNTTIAAVVTDHAVANICSNVYCHGGGVKVGAVQVKAPLTGGANQSPRWDAASQNQCGSCHGTTPTTPPTMGSHVRHSGSTGYSFSCDLCHPAIDVSHVQGNVRWAMKTTDPLVGSSAGYQAAGSLTPAAAGSTGDMAPSAAYGECSNLYCHSDGKGKPPRQNPTWGDSSYSTGCVNCHGNNADAVSTITSNGHKAHVDNTSVRFGGFNFRCQECHNSTVNSSDTGLISTSLHVNGAADVNWGPDAAYVPTGGTSVLSYDPAKTCTVYCHSNGKGRYKAPPQTWKTIGDNQQGVIECNYCHNGLAGIQNQMSSGRHLNHINGGPLPHRPVSCNWCHSNTVASNGQSVYNGTDVKHINRTIDVSFIKMANFSGSYSTSTHVCSNTYCHTNNATTSTRDWDTVTLNTCGNCHEANNTTTTSATLSAAHRKHYNTSSRPANTTEDGWANVNRSVSTNVFMCGVCHPGSPTTSHLSGPPAGVTNGSVAEVALRLPFTPPVGATRPETVTRGTGVNYDGRGYGYSTGTTCDTYCHSDGRGNPGKRNSTSAPRLEWTTSTGVVCGNCHNQYGDANPTWSGSHSKHLSGSRSANATCNACHAATAADNTTLIANRRDRHPNGFRNVTGNSIAGAIRWDSSAQQCTNVYCHFNKPVTWGGSLSGGCAGCHGYNAASADPIATKGHTAHVNNTSSSFSGFNFKCNECHASTVNAFDNVTAFSLHANRVNNVAWGPKSTGGLAYAANGCTQIYCHSNGAGVYKAPPTTWNNIAAGQQGTIECNYCHNGLAGVQRQMSSGRHLNHISAGPLPHKPVTCNWCHVNTVAANGRSVFNGTDVKHINRAIDINFIKMANFSGSFASTHVCSNTYCHGNNSTTQSRDWDTSTINTCGNCHEANNTTTSTATLSPAHRKHYNRSTRPSSTTEQGWTNVNLSSSTNVFMCGVCHPGSPTESHLNGPPAGVTNGSVAEVIMRPPFNNIPSGAGRPEVVYRGTGLIYDGRGYGYSTGTSCDTYCHSDGRGGLGKRNYANTLDLIQSPMTSVLRWTGRAAACGDCHNKAADDPNSQHTTWSKPHNKHANTYGNGGTIGSNNTSTNNTLVTCAACHASTTTSNTALLSGSRAKHPNGFRNISASSTVGSAAFRWDAGNNQCKNGYCHSRAFSFTDYSTPWIKWDTVQANVHCGSCHTAYPTGPDYQNGYKGKANSHPKHAVFWGFTCDWCHNGTVGSGGNTISSVRNHVNKNYNVVANGTKTFIGLPNTFTPTSANPPTTKTSCSNVNCHGGNASTVFTWGGTNKCGDCHFATADTVNYAFKNSTMAKIARAEWSWSGHGRQSGSYDVTGAAFAGFSSAAATAGGAGDPCLYCHEYSSVSHGDTNNPMRLRNFDHATWGRNGVCLVCHASVGATGVTPGPGYTAKTATQRKVDKYHFGSKHSTSLNGGQFCWDCHDSHGDRTSTNAGPIAMVHLKPSMTSDGTTGVPSSFTTNNVSFVAKAAASNWAKTAAPFNGICNVCHTYKNADPNKMVHYTATSSDSHNSGTVCTQCHLHSSDTTYNGFAYKGEPKICDGCHGGSNNGQLSVSTTAGHALHYNQGTVFNNLTGSNKTTATAYGFACKNCHPANLHNEEDGKADILAVVNYTFGSTNTTDSKGYPYSSGGTCSTNQCHQDGRGGAARTATVTWTAARSGSNCGVCHGNPPLYGISSSAHRGQVPTTSCSGCHNNVSATGTILNFQLHLNGSIEGPSCVSCHSKTVDIKQGPLANNGSRRAVSLEFNNTWSHKRSAGGAVTQYDCIVCHMEGEMSTGKPTSYHQNGLIELRDPDTGSTIKGVTFSGTPGSYTSTTVDAKPPRFSRDLGSPNVEADVAAIQINFCLKCHDGNGAVSTTAQVPGGTAEKPFATTIAEAGYTGAGITANGVTGGVTNIAAAFATSNSSYHPVMGKQNNWYAKTTRMVNPWNGATRGSSVDITSWGPLISCWDCHAPVGASGVQTSTVTAHGAQATLRGTATVTGTPAASTNETTLCKICHAGYNTSTSQHHGTGSALASSTHSSMVTYLRYGCNYCHSSSITASRPTRGENVHGFNRLAGTGTDSKWPRGTTETSRPYAFIRNTVTPLSLTNHRPLTAVNELTSGSATCTTSGGGSPCSNSMGSYTPGGKY
ncbi:cytochrome c, 53 heme-binding sites [Geotalea daltonii FRC-32]|uniref:Cytochrome c, 53 heme-binding sites n=1 Tax=Geotalea daltonii (strain DSM 22248 / JCM 15807 / FRC-32) TaxID=316067 RepID=B9M756_GEODF|nr:CxxxxCH/CxxCH domain-containing protein [Geotalea daltonii]ACM22077.1 cytochrome c, 53 heme-binding sites [Geotalea daltonii FRC-32]